MAKTTAKKRVKKEATYRSFKLKRRIKPTVTVPSAISLFRSSLQLLKKEWKLFGGLSLMFLVVQLIFVQGLGVTQSFSAIKEAIPDVIGTNSPFVVNVASLGYLLSSSGASDQITGLYQSIAVVLFSLATIWGLRQVYAARSTHSVSVRDAFYNGMQPLIQFLGVGLIASLQLLPATLLLSIYGIVRGNGLATTAVEQGVWVVFMAFVALLTLYMLVGTFIAFYIVTLPGMTPFKALRTAKRLVAGKRSVVVRRVIAFPVLLVIVGFVIMLPLISWLEFLVVPAVMLSGAALLSLLHAYMYAMYRGLMP